MAGNRLPTLGIQNVGEYSYSTLRLSLAHVAAVLLYALSGVAMIAVALFFKAFIQRPVVEGDSTLAATVLALAPVDLNHGLVAGVFVFLSVLLALPGVITNSRGFLKASSIVNVMATVATLAVGLELWFFTLIERQEYGSLWQAQSKLSAGLLQDRFTCCGYLNSTSPGFVQSVACPNADIAASRVGCAVPFDAFADSLLNKMFTSLFGLSGLAIVALLSGLVLVKRITELQRFRNIDLKKSAM